ncbi:unnamed protein product [Prorocentrum cordatum]|uniref:AGC-kinase C-terminal domain-containing protein n=1 Tax=Prorocentrum cordatum TaxID=2364126 RepID=A0ABN9SUJ0_9DINO|nr:unnamed protein product [Polarella glacialis]
MAPQPDDRPDYAVGEPGAPAAGPARRSEPSERLPMRPGGVQNLKSHAWFEGFKWEDMQSGKLAPPYKPVVKSKKDLANFSARPEDPTGPGRSSTRTLAPAGTRTSPPAPDEPRRCRASDVPRAARASAHAQSARRARFPFCLGLRGRGSLAGQSELKHLSRQGASG